jgi:hypothetical protein
VFSVKNFVKRQKELVVLPFVDMPVSAEQEFDWKKYAIDVAIPIIRKQYGEACAAIAKAEAYCTKEECDERRRLSDERTKKAADELAERSADESPELDAKPACIDKSHHCKHHSSDTKPQQLDDGEEGDKMFDVAYDEEFFKQ